MHFLSGSSRADHQRTEQALTQMDKTMCTLLSQCPANVLALRVIGSFCTPTFADLQSRNVDKLNKAAAFLELVFKKMQDLHLGRILGSDADIRFQKRHAQKLPEVTVAYLCDTLQVPLWLFGAHLPGPLPEPSFSQCTNLDKHVSSPKAQVIAVVSAGSAEAMTATANEARPIACASASAAVPKPLPSQPPRRREAEYGDGNQTVGSKQLTCARPFSTRRWL